MPGVPIRREALERVITGALRSAINDHGPITPDQIGSASKRIIGGLINLGLEVITPPPPPPGQSFRA